MVNHIPENIISEIRGAADIVDIVSDMVILKKAGKDYQGLCPFHTEKTPSFTVSPEKQMFYCFGCGTGGDVFKFLMMHEGVSFPEAVRTLAGRCGIEVPTPDMTPEEKSRIRERDALFDVNQQTMAYFRHILWKSPAGEPARAYLEQRRLDRAMGDAFGLGYAPEGWDHLIRFFSRKTTSTGLLAKAGLISPRKSGSGFYDRFRNRIIFPIMDIQNRVIGFGGRVMDESLPKYLNSPETPLFSKSRTLYGLHAAKAKCRETGKAFLVEGYFDVLSLHQVGISNAVATLGTALTPEHVRLLRGHAGQVILVFDSDQAGVRAAARSVEIFRKENMDARILVLPEGHDPDTYILEFGAEAFQEAALRARGVMEYMMEDAVARHGLSIEGKVRVISEMTKPLAAVDDPVAYSLYVRKLAERMGVDEAMIMEKLRAAPSGRSGNTPPQRAKPTQFQGRRVRMEQQMVTMMLQFPEILPEVTDRDLAKRFEDPTLKAIWSALIYQLRENNHRTTAQLIDSLEETHKSIASKFAMVPEEWSRKGCIRLIDQFERPPKGHRAEWTRKLKEAENNPVLRDKLLKDKQSEINSGKFM